MVVALQFAACPGRRAFSELELRSPDLRAPAAESAIFARPGYPHGSPLASKNATTCSSVAAARLCMTRAAATRSADRACGTPRSSPARTASGSRPRLLAEGPRDVRGSESSAASPRTHARSSAVVMKTTGHRPLEPQPREVWSDRYGPEWQATHFPLLPSPTRPGGRAARTRERARPPFTPRFEANRRRTASRRSYGPERLAPVDDGPADRGPGSSGACQGVELRVVSRQSPVFGSVAHWPRSAPAGCSP